MASMHPDSSNSEHQGSFSYKNATQEDVIEDLTSRFILNLPDHELVSLERVCFQVEQAHWYYEDFIREQNPKFPSMSLKKFSAMFFRECPLLAHWSDDHEQAFSNFMSYKTQVPVCGAIMLNDTWDKCVLVKGWKASSGWGFPKGKINEDEPPSSCAIREVLEETGYNLAGQLVPEDVIELTIQGQRISLFIVPGVPEDYPFKTKTRKEISKIEWFRLSELPTWKRNKSNAGRFYLITPFIGPLKTFIHSRKPRKPQRQPRYEEEDFSASGLESDFYTEPSSMISSASEIEESPAPIQATTYSEQGNVPMDPHFAQLLSGLAISANSSDPQNHSNGTSAKGEHKSTLSDLSLSKTTPKIAHKVHPPHPQSKAPRPFKELGSSGRTPLGPRRNEALPPADTQSFTRASEPTPSASSSIPLPSQDTPSHQFSAPLRSGSALSIQSPPLTHPPRAPSSAAGNLKHIAVLEHISKESARMMESFKLSQKSPTLSAIPDNSMYTAPATGPIYQSPRMSSPASQAIPMGGMHPIGPITFPARTPAPPAAPYPIYPISPQMLGHNFNPANDLSHPPVMHNVKPPTSFTQITPYSGPQAGPAYSPMLSRPFSAAAAPPPTNVFQLGTTGNLHTPYPFAANSTGPGENTLLSILNRPRFNSQLSRPRP